MPITAHEVDTPEKFADLCEEIKAGILEVIEETILPGAITAGEKVARVENRRIIDVGREYANKLRSERHKALEEESPDKVHAYMVGYGGIDTNIPSTTTGTKTFQLRFLIDSYYEDDIGTSDDNAEKRHAREVHMISYALFRNKVLNRPGIVHRVERWEERRGFATMGETMTRESLGELFVKILPIPLNP